MLYLTDMYVQCIIFVLFIHIIVETVSYICKSGYITTYVHTYKKSSDG